MTKHKQSFQYGAVILLCSAVLVKLIGALFKIPLSSDWCLGDLGFGYFSSAYDIFTPIYSVAMAGLPIAVSKAVSECSAQKRFNDVRAMLKISRKIYLTIGIIGFVLMSAFIYPFYKLTNLENDAVLSLALITPSVLFCCLMSALRGYYEGLGNMYPTAISEVIEALCKLILGLGFGFFTVKATNNVSYGAAAAIFGISLGTAIAALYLRIYYKYAGDKITPSELAKSSPAIDRKTLSRYLIVIAVPIALASLSSNIALIVDALTVKWQLGKLFEENNELISKMFLMLSQSEKNTENLPILLYGIRSKAYTLYNLIPTFVTVIGVSAVPVIAEFNKNKEPAKLKKSVNSVFKLSAIISFPAGIGLIVASKQIMGLLYDSSASVSIGSDILKIFGGAALFSGLVIPLTSVLQSLGCQKAALFNIAIGATAKIIIGAITVLNPIYNIKGAAISTLCCYAVILILHIITLIKSAKIIPDFMASLVKPFVAALLCGVTAFLVLRINSSDFITLLAIFLSAIIYIISLIALKTFDKEDFSSLPKGEILVKFCTKHRIIR